MYLLDLLFRLPPKTFVRIKFAGNPKTFCFTTGQKTSPREIARMRQEQDCVDKAKVAEIYPLWHAEELYVECS